MSKIIYIGRKADGNNPEVELPSGDLDLSRDHARLEIRENNDMFLYDKSTNGTWHLDDRKPIGENNRRQIVKGDLVRFGSNKQVRLDWKQLDQYIGGTRPQPNPEPILTPTPTPTPGSGFKMWWVLLPLSLLLLGGAAWWALGQKAPVATCKDNVQNQGETGVDCGGPCRACIVDGGGREEVFTMSRIASEYRKSVGVVAMVYYLTVITPDGQKIFVGRPKAQVDASPNPYDPAFQALVATAGDKAKKLYPFKSIGTGFLLNHNIKNSKESNLITTRSIINPGFGITTTTSSIAGLENQDQWREVINAVKEYFRKGENWQDVDVEFEISEVSPPRFYASGSASIDLTDKTFVEQIDYFKTTGKECSVLGWSKDEDIDLAQLRIKSTDSDWRFINYPSEVVTDINELNQDDPIFIYGFPTGNFNSHDQSISAKKRTGIIDSEPNTNQILHTASGQKGNVGAPVFSKNGKLCGINTKSKRREVAIPTARNLKRFLEREDFKARQQ